MEVRCAKAAYAACARPVPGPLHTSLKDHALTAPPAGVPPAHLSMKLICENRP